jgi:hypothetical protein
MFVPVEPGLNNAFAQIDESGNNQSLAPQPQTGGPTNLPKGVSPELRAKMAARAAAKPPAPNPNYSPIPTKYYQVETSGLKFKIEPGEQTHNIELKSQ